MPTKRKPKVDRLPLPPREGVASSHPFFQGPDPGYRLGKILEVIDRTISIYATGEYAVGKGAPQKARELDTMLAFCHDNGEAFYEVGVTCRELYGLGLLAWDKDAIHPQRLALLHATRARLTGVPSPELTEEVSP